MPYISTEEVKEIRTRIKKAFPDYKFSITKEHYSSVNIRIMKGPIAVTKEQTYVNHFYFENSDVHTDEQKALIRGIMNAIRGVKPSEIESEDADYGSIPNYYTSIGFGKWNKEYEQI